MRGDIRGCVILANHPSLIDVVILTVMVPRTFAVAKASLRRNPWIGMIVRRVFLYDDARLMEEAPALLRRGYNILIFPEGTRSPGPREMHAWHRGGVQVALRALAPIQPMVLKFERRLLGKGQSILDMGARSVGVEVRALERIPALAEVPVVCHSLAVKYTRELTAAVQAEIA